MVVDGKEKQGRITTVFASFCKTEKIRFVMQDKRHEAVPDRLFVPLTGLGDVSAEAEPWFDLNHLKAV